MSDKRSLHLEAAFLCGYRKRAMSGKISDTFPGQSMPLQKGYSIKPP
ncbi:hypothetical protein GXP67_08820 [Rhodocytophaga rosea]|uniref:Uncharacterized protein n=1 Tax=Rhodocytophaga rosea TaxID=2704465 RepID=A0A6C0GFW2_9BACT|nr:hypothetical protein [Rhodocytophaga rosea]QHT66755.1 hypothetical protein GXP67_08820 [Rhodocytophaga rosea]